MRSGECYSKKVAGTQPTKNAGKVIIVNVLRLCFPWELLLRLIGLARSSFFYYIKPKIDKNAEILQQIEVIYRKNDENYGCRRITLELRKYWIINHKRVQAMKRLNGAKPIRHSDQGWQYQMIGYRNILKKHSIKQRYVEKRQLS